MFSPFGCYVDLPVVYVDGTFLLCCRQGLVVGIHADCQCECCSCHTVGVERLHTHMKCLSHTDTCLSFHKQHMSMPFTARVADCQCEACSCHSIWVDSCIHMTHLHHSVSSTWASLPELLQVMTQLCHAQFYQHHHVTDCSNLS